MCETTDTGSGLCDEVAIMLVYTRYAMHCQRLRERRLGREGTTVYFIPDGKGSITGYSIFSVTVKKEEKWPFKRFVGVEVRLHSFLTSAQCRSLYAIVAQSKNCPFGVNTTIELKNVTPATYDNNGSWRGVSRLTSVLVLSDVVVKFLGSIIVLTSNDSF
jgi:hypothetical protein